MTWMGPPPDFTEHRPQPEPGSVPVDNSVGWLLTVAPVLILLIDAALLFGGFVEAYTWSLLAAVAVNVALAVLDTRLLRQRGYDLSTGLAVFLIPVYLIQRARRTGQTYAMPAVWVAVFVASVTGSFALERALGVVQLDMPTVEAMLQDWIDDAVPGVTSGVGCPPEDAYQVGESFFCVVNNAPGVSTMRVTVEAADGSISWQPVG
jgi:hypothetical protein